MSTVQIAHSDALKLFEDLKSTQCHKWDAKTMAKMLTGLPDKLGDANGELKIPKSSKAVLDKVIDAVDNKTKIQIVDDVEEESEIDIDEPVKKTGRPAKKESTAKPGRPAKSAKSAKSAKKESTAKSGRPAKSAKSATSGKTAKTSEKKERKVMEQRTDTAQMKILVMVVKNPELTKEKIVEICEKKGIEAGEWTVIWAKQAYSQVIKALELAGKKVR